MTQDEIREAVSDPVALVATLYGEARSEPIEGVIGVACVIRNRVYADLNRDQKPDWWGESFREVCLKKWQFSCWWEDNANTRAVYALAEGLMVNFVSVDRELLSELRWISTGIIENLIRDITFGSDHYLTSTLYRRNPPHWARDVRPVCAIGNHAFFKLN